jgi:hypothetical protein
MTAAQYIRWSNRREAARSALQDAIDEMRASIEVTESSTLTIHVGTAEDCVSCAIGCAQGAIDLLWSAMESMSKEVTK